MPPKSSRAARLRPVGKQQAPPAPPHTYWATKIYTSKGLILRCHVPNCQDENHAVRAALGFDR